MRNARTRGIGIALVTMAIVAGSLWGIGYVLAGHAASAAQPAMDSRGLIAGADRMPGPLIRGQLRVPRADEIERRLRDSGRLGPDAAADAVDRAVNEWIDELQARSLTGEASSLAPRGSTNERQVLSSAQQGDGINTTVAVLVVPVEFAVTETLTYQVPEEMGTGCVTTTGTFAGPRHGEVPYPGGGADITIDNQTVYYPSTEPEDYARLIFGREGYTEPLRSGDPNVNEGAGADIRGLTVQSYFDAQSDGTVAITGTVVPWVPVPHAEAFYGIDQCLPNMPEGLDRTYPDEQLGTLDDLVVTALQSLKDRGGAFARYDYWQQFDTNGDGLIDDLWLIHAGRGQDYGGGNEGEAALWTRSSNLTLYPAYANGFVVHDNDTPDPEDDLRVTAFTLLPEDGDIGVMVERISSHAFGLPPHYTMTSTTSVGFWAPLSAGVWGGELAGTRPVNMLLWQRMTADCQGEACGWADPIKTVTYTTAPETVVLGQAGQPAGGTVPGGSYDGQTIYEGLRIELPDQEETIPNLAGTGGGAYSGYERELPHLLSADLELPAGTMPITLSVDAYWQIPRWWGFAYFEVQGAEGGYVSLPDLDGRFTDEDPYGTNDGYGLTGSGQGALRFDLSAYAGQSIRFRWRYYADEGTPGNGLWLDNLVIPAIGRGEDFENGLVGWAASEWFPVPYLVRHPHYYLVEWRNANGFDEALLTAYNSSYSDAQEWRVDRVPANVPGALVTYRNGKYAFTGDLAFQQNDPPSIGPKYPLLVVDTNFWPRERPSGESLNGRLDSVDATLALQDQPDYSLDVIDPWTREVLDTDTMAGTPGIRRFNDALGYVPGFFATATGQPEPWDDDVGVVLPSLDGRTYSTRITHPDRSRPHPLDGTSAGGSHFYGSGDPGDENAHHGVRIEVVDQAADGSWGAVRVHNGAVDYTLEVEPPLVTYGGTVSVTAVITNRGAVEAVAGYTVDVPDGWTLVSGEPTGQVRVARGAAARRTVVLQTWPVLPAYPDSARLAATFADETRTWSRAATVRFTGEPPPLTVSICLPIAYNKD